MVIEDRKTDVIWALRVRSLGALVLRASLVDGKWEFNGLSIFTEEELLFD